MDSHRAKEMADEEQYQRVIEDAVVKEKAEAEREQNQAEAAKAIDAEQERRVADKGAEEEKKEKARRLSVGLEKDGALPEKAE